MMRLFMIACFRKCSFRYIHKCTLAVAYISSVVQHVYYYVGLMISKCHNKAVYTWPRFAYTQILHICKFCIRQQKYFLLCVHMAFKDQQNLSKVEILFSKSNSYFLELMTCLNVLIWILQVSKLLLGESTYVTMHML